MFIIVTSKENKYLDKINVKPIFTQGQNIISGTYNFSTCFPYCLIILFIFTIQNILDV